MAKAMSEAAKLQLKHSIRYSRPFHSSPSGITVVVDMLSPERGEALPNLRVPMYPAAEPWTTLQRKKHVKSLQ